MFVVTLKVFHVCIKSAFYFLQVMVVKCSRLWLVIFEGTNRKGAITRATTASHSFDWIIRASLHSVAFLKGQNDALSCYLVLIRPGILAICCRAKLILKGWRSQGCARPKVAFSRSGTPAYFQVTANRKMRGQEDVFRVEYINDRRV